MESPSLLIYCIKRVSAMVGIIDFNGLSFNYFPLVLSQWASLKLSINEDEVVISFLIALMIVMIDDGAWRGLRSHGKRWFFNKILASHSVVFARPYPWFEDDKGPPEHGSFLCSGDVLPNFHIRNSPLCSVVVWVYLLDTSGGCKARYMYRLHP